MSQTDSTLVFYNSFKERLGSDMNLKTDTFKMLLTSSSYSPSASHSIITDITNELSGNGYSRQTLGSVTYVQASGTATFDFSNVEFTAVGGSITARYFVIYNDTLTNDPLIAYGLLDDTPADVVATDGNKIELVVDASGLFTVA